MKMRIKKLLGLRRPTLGECHYCGTTIKEGDICYEIDMKFGPYGQSGTVCNHCMKQRKLRMD